MTFKVKAWNRWPKPTKKEVVQKWQLILDKLPWGGKFRLKEK